MRSTHYLAVLSLNILVVLSGCKIVPNPDPNSIDSASADLTDAERMTIYTEEIWQEKVLPTVSDNLIPIIDLRIALARGLDSAGAKHGLRPKGEANLWNFAVNGSGTIIEANPTSRAAKLKVDTDADGKADVTIQLGPVIRGTAMRDAMPFLIFSNFRDQIEFAKLARALNAKANEQLSLPESDLIGKTAYFEGVFTLRKPADIPEVVPITLTIGGS